MTERQTAPSSKANAAPTPEQFANATWEDIAPLYDTLAARDLIPGDTEGIESWLADWNALDVALAEATMLVDFAASGDTADPVKEEAYLRFSSQIAPHHTEQIVRLANKLLASGYTRPDLETTLHRFRTNRDIFREENISLEQDLSSLRARYNKVTGSLTIPWEGERVPISRLNPMLQSPDRDLREQAFRLQFEPYIEQRDEFADIFDAQLEKRQQLARNAGFANYRDYMFSALHRYDYTPEDCFGFHEAVFQTVIPAVRRRLESRRQQMGLATLRPWDTSVDPQGRPALTPYGSIEELNARTQGIFAKVDPVFGEQFGIMRAEHLLDLDSRTGKRPGGFCDTFPYRKRPFIFMNASGTGLDVRVLLHEAGHGFHGFAASNLPFVHQRFSGQEMEEVGSMSMELLASPYLKLEDGGFYTAAEYKRDRIEHLEERLTGFAWIATIDAFQHWLYTDPTAKDRDARDAKWLETWSRFDTGIDWNGLEAERTARWHRQLHIFLYPFYYIEYGLATLAALQVWRNALHDQEKAVADYRVALALGGSRPLPELYARAGARLIFDTAGMAEMVNLVESQLASIEAEG